MSADNRLLTAAVAVAGLSAALSAGSSWFWAMQTRDGARAVTAAVHIQSSEIVRLHEKVDALQRSCARSSPTSVADSVAMRSSASSADPPAGPTPEKVEAAEAARHFLDEAVHGQRWTPRHAKDFRSLLSGVAPEDRIALQRRLAVAINNRDLVLDPRDP